MNDTNTRRKTDGRIHVEMLILMMSPFTCLCVLMPDSVALTERCQG